MLVLFHPLMAPVVIHDRLVLLAIDAGEHLRQLVDLDSIHCNEIFALKLSRFAFFSSRYFVAFIVHIKSPGPQPSLCIDDFSLY